jgi:membrane fusion protein, macrolide-specific efflux system
LSLRKQNLFSLFFLPFIIRLLDIAGAFSMSILSKLKKPFIFIPLLVGVIGLIFSLAHHKSLDPLTLPLKKGAMMECVYGVGTVTSNKTLQVKSGIPSKIRALFVKEGDYVEAGAKIIELETLFTAPFAGTITTVSGSLGESVFPQSTLVNLTDLKDRYIAVTLDQTGALKVQKNQQVRINFDGLREKTFEGKVSSIYPQNNHFLVHIETPNLPEEILPGMTADVAIEISEHKDILLIPVAALDKNQVFVKKEQKFLPISVKIGLIDGTMAEVTSGELQEGDQLLLQNRIK